MGRQELIQHIQAELHSETSSTEPTQNSDDIFCQNCGTTISRESGQQGDYVVHRVPEHGEAEMKSVFYCGPNCFQEAMDALFDV